MLISPLGYSPTGETFNLSLEDVATRAAIDLDADKLVFLMDEAGVADAEGELRRSLTTAEAEALLATPGDLDEDVRLHIPRSALAATARVVSRHIDGALLQELFTHEGIGTMLTEDRLETLRPATINDVGGLIARSPRWKRRASWSAARANA